MSNPTDEPTTTSFPPGPPAYKAAFLTACLSADILTIGSYRLKSGRQSPYFFNASLFLSSATLFRTITAAYASSLLAHSLARPSFAFDVVFGPAYSAIPLAAGTCTELARLDAGRFGHVGCAFNRKEVKGYGLGGRVVGAELRGKRVVVVDDVITAGTAVREAVNVIGEEGGVVVGVVVALDRMERIGIGADGDPDGVESALGRVGRELGVPVWSIVTLDDLVDVLKERGSEEDGSRVQAYRRTYGVEK